MASGTVFAEFGAWDGEPPSSNPAGFTIRNQQWHVAFDSAVAESMVFAGILQGYSGGGLTVDVFWKTTVTTGGIALDGQFERQDLSGLDTDSDSFATAKTVTDTAPGTAGMIKKASFTFLHSEIDGLADGENFRFKLARQVAHASDDLNADCQVRKIVVKET